MIHKIVLTGETKSTNTIYKITSKPFPHIYLTAKGKVLKEEYHWEMLSQFKGRPFTEKVKVEIHFYIGNKRKHDLDNLNKLILDSAEGVLFENDNQIHRLELEKFYDKENPRIELFISEYDK